MTPHRSEVAGKKFVVVGISRLTVRVARTLAAHGGDVTVVAGDAQEDLVKLLEDPIQVIHAEGEPEDALRRFGVEDADCLLALAEDDLENLHVAAASCALDPELPVVLRAFDPSLAEQLEQAANVRRAYSVSALSAPAFVAAALTDELVETMRLGDGEVPLCKIRVTAKSPLAGRRVAAVEKDFGCTIVARGIGGSEWAAVSGEADSIQPDEELLIGGPLLNVMEAAVRNSGAFRRRGRRFRMWARFRRKNRRSTITTTLLPGLALGLGIALAAMGVVFGIGLGLAPLDAIAAIIPTAFGDAGFAGTDPWLRLLAAAIMIIGGALFGVLISHLSAVATADRLEQQMGRRAAGYVGHIVVAGLGTVGYRVVRVLTQLGIPCVAIERSPDSRFLGAMTQRVPVLSGDIRLAENLERAGILGAASLIACTDDDLANVAACLQAKRLNDEIRTVARIFDEGLAERALDAFGIDNTISATRIASGAFVGAASNERALRRFRIGDHDYVGMRYDVTTEVNADALGQWSAAGIHVLAYQREERDLLPAHGLDRLEAGDFAIVCGPEAAVRTHVLGAAD